MPALILPRRPSKPLRLSGHSLLHEACLRLLHNNHDLLAAGFTTAFVVIPRRHQRPGHAVFCKKIVLNAPHVASYPTVEHVMKTLDATSRAGGAVAVVVMSAVLSGCYSYVPYGYVPYGELPVAVVERKDRSVADLGLTLAEGRALLAEVQSLLVSQQTAG